MANSAVVHVRGEIERIRGDVDRLDLEHTELAASIGDPRTRRAFFSRSATNCSKNSGSFATRSPALKRRSRTARSEPRNCTARRPSYDARGPRSTSGRALCRSVRPALPSVAGLSSNDRARSNSPRRSHRRARSGGPQTSTTRVRYPDSWVDWPPWSSARRTRFVSPRKPWTRPTANNSKQLVPARRRSKRYAARDTTPTTVSPS